MIAYRKVSTNISMELVSPYNAEIIFKLVEENRKYLSEYLTWVEKTKNSEQIYDNIKKALIDFSEKKSVDYVIREGDEIIGRISIWLNNENTNTYEIGYWIIAKKSKKGITTSCVKEIMKVGIEYMNVEKFEIICVAENIGSNKIAKKIGYKLEGTKRNAKRVNNIMHDMNEYGMLKSEYERHRTIASTG